MDAPTTSKMTDKFSSLGFFPFSLQAIVIHPEVGTECKQLFLVEILDEPFAQPSRFFWR